MEKKGDAVIVGRAVGYDEDAAPESGCPDAEGQGTGFFRYEMDSGASEPCECGPVWDGSN